MDEQEYLEILENPDKFLEKVRKHIAQTNEPLLGEDLAKIDEVLASLSQDLAKLKAEGLEMKDRHRSEEVHNKIAQIQKDAEYKRALSTYNTVRTTIASNRMRP